MCITFYQSVIIINITLVILDLFYNPVHNYIAKYVYKIACLLLWTNRTSASDKIPMKQDDKTRIKYVFFIDSKC